MNVIGKPDDELRGGRRRPPRTPQGRQVDPAALDEVSALLTNRGRAGGDLLIEHLHLVRHGFPASSRPWRAQSCASKYWMRTPKQAATTMRRSKILWAALNVLKLSIPQFQTLMFVYLMYSAQATIYLTRVRRRFWSFAPSPYVAAATIGNVMVASTLAVWGVMMAPVPALLLAGMLGAVLAAAVLLDQVKSWIFQTMEMTGDRVNWPKLRA